MPQRVQSFKNSLPLVGSYWLTPLVEAGEGGNLIFTAKRQPKDKTLSKIAQTTMVNRSRMRDVGDTLYAIHYVCPDIGKLALTDELTAFTNQTARFRNTQRAFIFAGESYTDILSELEHTSRMDTKLILYGDAYLCLQLPIHLLSCDDTGAVQLQIMSVPDYRRKLTQAALKNQYQPPPKDAPAWDAVFQGLSFVMAADMDLRRIDAALQSARARGMKQIAIAALEKQAEAVLFSRYRDPSLARVFVLTDEAVSAVTVRPPVP